jgi:hypothetical protein
MFNVQSFIKIYGILIVVSISVLIANQYLLPFIIQKTTFELLLVYSPLVILTVLILTYTVRKKYGTDLMKILSKKRLKK